MKTLEIGKRRGTAVLIRAIRDAKVVPPTPTEYLSDVDNPEVGGTEWYRTWHGAIPASHGRTARMSGSTASSGTNASVLNGFGRVEAKVVIEQWRRH